MFSATPPAIPASWRHRRNEFGGAQFGGVAGPRRQWLGRSAIQRLYGSDETVAALGPCLQEAGIAGGVAENIAHLIDGCVQAVIEINECVLWPEACAQFFARHHLVRAFEESNQHL